MKQLTKKIKDKWLAALKSGDYIQGTGRFKIETEQGVIKHCCLGVLCEATNNPVSTGRGMDNYCFVETLIDTNMVSELWGTNDLFCDDKYTSVIPLIEQLPTID